jgi:iron complex transport system substrate-binding protein
MRQIWGALLVLVMVITAVGCASGSVGNGNQAGGSSPEANPSAPAQVGKRTQYPLTVRDATGQEVTFDKAPERIVSLSPAETETLYALGLGDKLVAVSDFCDYPEAAKSKPKIGGVRSPNVEAILGASPDFVAGGISTSEASVSKLRELKLIVYKAEQKNLDEVLENILNMGRITDTQEQAEKLVAEMKAKRGMVTEAVKGLKPEQKLKVYMEFSPGWTVGKGEYMHEMIELSGAVNIAADLEGWKKINEEKVIQDNPDIILYAKDLIDSKTKQPLEAIIKGRSGWSNITAIRNNRVIGLDESSMSRPGPRLVDALVSMAQAVYPDLVK